MEQGPTEPHAGRGTLLLSSGGAGGGYYGVASGTGPIATENQFLCQTLVACLSMTPPPSPPPHCTAELAFTWECACGSPNETRASPAEHCP